MATQVQVIVFPRGQLTPKDKERLTKAGVVAVEADDPRAVVTVLPTTQAIGSNDFSMALLYAVRNCPIPSTAQNFVADLHKRLRAAEGSDPSKTASGS